MLIRERNPQEVEIAKAFQRGARAVEPSVSVKVEVIDRSAGNGAYEAAVKRLVERGAEVLFQAAESPELARAARGAGKPLVAWGEGASSPAPSTLGAVRVDWAGFYMDEIARVIEHRPFDTSQATVGVAEGALRLEGLSPLVQGPALQRITDRSQAYAQGAVQAMAHETRADRAAASEVDRLVGYRETEWSSLEAPRAPEDGAPVRISGFVVPLEGKRGAEGFLLVPEYHDDADGAEHPIHQLVYVQGRPGARGLKAMDAVSVSGHLKSQPRKTALGAAKHTLVADRVEPYARQARAAGG